MRRDRLWTALALGAALAFGVGLVVFATRALTRGGAYPEYSTFRADPLGAKALHDTLARLPGVEVTRSLRPLRLLKARQTTVFWLGEAIWTPPAWKKDQFDAFDRVLKNHNRLVMVFAPAAATKLDGTGRRGLLEQLWGVRLRLDVQSEAKFKRNLRDSHAWLELVDAGAWTCFSTNANGHCQAAERKLSGGTLVLATRAYPLSNEGLRIARDSAYLARLTGDQQRFVFDEDHLGLEDASSIGLLLRQFNQQGAIAALLLLFALFVWRSTASFLPSRPATNENVEADAHRSLILLLRRGLPRDQLKGALLAEWRRALPLLPVRHRTRGAQIEAALEDATDARTAWQQARQKLQGLS